MMNLTNKRVRYKLYATVLSVIGIFSIFIHAFSERYEIVNNFDRGNDAVSSSTIGELASTTDVQISNLNDNLCQSKFVSLCSCDADKRGFHQNVIAYSLYGNFSNPKHFSRYVDPIKAILSNISESYPGKH